MNYKYYWEDFYPGQILEAGGISLSEEEIIGFAKKYDPQPFHTDREKAKQAGFQWDPGSKRWLRTMAIDDAASLPFKTKQETK